MSLVRNEQIKLLAGNLDRLSSAFAIIGVVTPVIAWSRSIGPKGGRRLSEEPMRHDP